jgi:alcohol dehydrogenase
MKAAVIFKYGSEKNNAVQIIEMPTPKISGDEILIRIAAASVNPVDFKIREGGLKAILKYQFPLKLGNDLSGTIAEVGKNITQYVPGQKIYARVNKKRIGTFAEFIAVFPDEIALVPKNLTLLEAASLPLVGLTSWQALIDIGKLKAGQRVLIHAGSGGVGTFAIQLAHDLGAHVTTTTSKANFDFVRSLGADVAIDYRTTAFDELPGNYDLIFDTQGGETLARSFRVLKPGGTIVSISGPPTPAFADEWELGILLKTVFRLLSFKITRLAQRASGNYHFLFMHHSGAELGQIAQLVEAKKIKPIIDRTFPFAQTELALQFVSLGRTRGKVVIEIESAATLNATSPRTENQI